MSKKVIVTKSVGTHKEFGKVVKLEFENDSKIFISKKGWNIILPKNKKHMDLINTNNKIEVNLSFAEINLALEESAEAGYSQSAEKTTEVKDGQRE